VFIPLARPVFTLLAKAQAQSNKKIAKNPVTAQILCGQEVHESNILLPMRWDDMGSLGRGATARSGDLVIESKKLTADRRG
jgi:hypothetical protein